MTRMTKKPAPMTIAMVLVLVLVVVAIEARSEEVVVPAEAAALRRPGVLTAAVAAVQT